MPNRYRKLIIGGLGTGLILFGLYCLIMVWAFSPLADILVAVGAVPVERLVPWHLFIIVGSLAVGTILLWRALKA